MLVVVIVIGMFVAMVILFLKRYRIDACRRDDQLAVKARGLDQTLEPAFKLQTVDDQHICLCHRCRVLRRWLIDMRVAIGAHDRGQVNMFAADFAHHVAKDGEGGHNLGLAIGQSRSGRGQRQRDKRRCRFQKRDTRRHFSTFPVLRV